MSYGLEEEKGGCGWGVAFWGSLPLEQSSCGGAFRPQTPPSASLLAELGNPRLGRERPRGQQVAPSPVTARSVTLGHHGAGEGRWSE